MMLETIVKLFIMQIAYDTEEETNPNDWVRLDRFNHSCEHGFYIFIFLRLNKDSHRKQH